MAAFAAMHGPDLIYSHNAWAWDQRDQTPRLHHAHRRRDGVVAARGPRATAGKDPAYRHYRRLAPLERLPSRVARSRLPRRPEHRLRLCVWRWGAGATRRGGGGARSSPGGRHCDLRHARKLRGQAGHHHDSYRHDLDRRSRARRPCAKPRPTGRKYHRQHHPWPGRRCKRLQILKEVIPTVSRVAFLWNPDNASNVLQLEEIQAAAPRLGVTVISVSVSPRIEFETAFAAMMKERPDAFAVTGEPFHQIRIAWIMDFMAKNRLPAVYQLSENVRAGGLMSYGASQPDLFRRAAGYVHKILQGKKPADLPVEQPVKFELAVNLKTAKAIGLMLPPGILALADEVIE